MRNNNPEGYIHSGLFFCLKALNNLSYKLHEVEFNTI